MKEFTKRLAIWMWQLPQNMIALLLCNLLGHWSYYGGKYRDNYVIITKAALSSFALGDYIFLTPFSREESINHELGHCRQSEILGPLYIPIIVVPSLLNNMYDRLMKAVGIEYDYFSFYTEKLANKLGGYSPINLKDLNTSGLH